jgi:hypothetical protein
MMANLVGATLRWTFMARRPAAIVALAFAFAMLTPPASPAAAPDLTRFSLMCARMMLAQTHAMLTQCGLPITAEQEGRYQRMGTAYEQALRSRPGPEADNFFAGERRALQQLGADANLCVRMADAIRLFAAVTTAEFERQFNEALATNGPTYNPPGSCL